ncbi:MarR family winged helix-turn-helix transcriptional regulator [Microlunatus ginsengisoli]|uniref:MarR family transcriptional regulator n=1 Tax=Microlunatus ginsengisoli TaxID=363863 RepID=A0ABP6ZF16_9ACTN
MVDSSVAADVDAVMRAARVISAIIAGSVAQTDDAVTMPQLRALVLVATRAEVNASAVAHSLSIHLSNASRLCDRLVQAGWLDRRQSSDDRRNLVLSLTPAGSRLLASVMDHRRRAFAAILLRMPTAGRAALIAGLNEFADTAGEPDERDLLLP